MKNNSLLQETPGDNGSWRQNRGKIPNRLAIEQRCLRVYHCPTVGYQESDTIIGQNHEKALISLVKDRPSCGLICRVKAWHAEGVARAILIVAARYKRELERSCSTEFLRKKLFLLN